MWLWWIVSVIVLVVCLIFAIRAFAASRHLQRLISSENPSLHNAPDILKIKPNVTITRQEQEIAELRMKLRGLEENANNYGMQISRLTGRVEVMEAVSPQKVSFSSKNEDENWKELYFETLDKNEKLENELDSTRSTLEDLETRVAEIMQNERDFSAQQSNLEQRLIEVQFLQNSIRELQQKLEGGEQREKQLRTELAAEENTREELKKMKQQYGLMYSEASELRNRISEVNNRDLLLQQKLSRLGELESNFQNSESDKTELRRTVEEIILENELLSSKLTDLQEKLAQEKYF